MLAHRQYRMQQKKAQQARQTMENMRRFQQQINRF
jgi:hypothetical protein